MRDAQAQLGRRVDRRAGSVVELSKPEAPIVRFAESLCRNLEAGERRAIHRRPYVRRKPVPRRSSMLDPHVARIEAWLAAEPHLTAVAIVDLLRECAPAAFGDQQRRTIQRFVRFWRAKTAKLLIDGGEAMISLGSPPVVPAGTTGGDIVTYASSGAR